MKPAGPTLLAVICPNGLGHFRRALEVLHHLSQLQPDLRLVVVCGQWQRKRMHDWRVLGDLEKGGRVEWVHDILEPGVRWSLNPADYSDGSLQNWVSRLEKVEGMMDADLVLSDNLSGVLELRSDAVLMGSFLWSDVLEEAYPAAAGVPEFIAAERALLERHRPQMLCVGAMAMPGVLERTRAVPLPWMRSGIGRPNLSRPIIRRSNPKVAVLMGATGAADSMAIEAASALLDRGARVSLPRGIHEALSHRPGVSLFGFGVKDFLDCDLALCRPGLGSIHDCIFHGLPMVLAQETGNFEMNHNGNRIEVLGLGINLGHRLAAGEIAERLLAFAGTPEPELIRGRMEKTPLDGIELAAQWLQERIVRNRLQPGFRGGPGA